MKRKILLLFIVLLVFVFAKNASAHSGRTDGKGGHYDHSTGEYHYHHGYPPHDHKDMDGDGKVDCPYKFDDQTDHNSGTENSGNGGGSNSGAVANPPTNPPKQPQISEGKDHSGNIWVTVYLWIIVLVILAFCWRGISTIFSILAERRKQKKENKRILEKIGIPNLKVPWDISLVEDGLPICGDKSEYAPHGEYTMYLSGNGGMFHAKYGCSNARKPVHLFEAFEKYKPCGKCAKNVIRTIPEWYKTIQDKQKDQTKESEKHQKQAEEGKTANQKRFGKVVLKSSFVKSAEYQDGVLYLELGNSEYYAYYNVPDKIFNELIKTDSPGRYFHDKISGKYPYVPYHE